MRTANPALSDKAFQAPAAVAGETMTVQGTVNKTGLCLLLLTLSATWTWSKAFGGSNISGAVMAGLIAGFITALITIFKKQWALITAPLYALFEGMVLGGISAVFEAQYPGIAIQAVSLTFGTLFALLFAYRTGVIRVTENLKLGIVAATGGIFVVYLVNWIMSFFGTGIPFIHQSGFLGIGFSIFVVIIAALNLVLDFDFIEKASMQNVPKYMEWYGAFGLIVTLVWLYLEILRLLAKLNQRR